MLFLNFAYAYRPKSLWASWLSVVASMIECAVGAQAGAASRGAASASELGPELAITKRSPLVAKPAASALWVVDQTAARAPRIDGVRPRNGDMRRRALPRVGSRTMRRSTAAGVGVGRAIGSNRSRA
jgi:hypothetical protein